MAQNLLRVRQTLMPSRVLCLQTANYHGRSKIGNREIVGYGIQGEPMYHDHPTFPFASVRFRENTPDIAALHDKEKGDWKKLTLEEKKALYRASFCQTYSEMKAPSGVWKPMLTAALVVGSITLWFYVWMKKYVYGPLPESFSPESKAAQLKRMIDLRVNPVDGLASHWDYEKGRWKD